MCNLFTNEHTWIFESSRTDEVDIRVGQPCNCGAYSWSGNGLVPEITHDYGYSLDNAIELLQNDKH